MNVSGIPWKRTNGVYVECDPDQGTKASAAHVVRSVFGPPFVWMALDGCTLALAIRNNRIVGVASLARAYVRSPEKGAWLIENLCVLPTWRRQGIGRALFAALDRFARESDPDLPLTLDPAIEALEFWQDVAGDARLAAFRQVYAERFAPSPYDPCKCGELNWRCRCNG